MIRELNKFNIKWSSKNAAMWQMITAWQPESQNARYDREGAHSLTLVPHNSDDVQLPDNKAEFKYGPQE